MEENSLPDVSPAEALRSSFGDRKPPDISRKITACVACRKQKIKCHMRNSEPPCIRCKQRNLPCTVNRSLQMLLEEDVTWKHSMEQKMGELEKALAQVQERLSIPEENPSQRVDHQGDHRLRQKSGLHLSATSDHHHPSNPSRTWEVLMDTDSGPAAIPASCVAEVQDPHHHSAVSRSFTFSRDDLVSRGVVSSDQAQLMFDMYAKRLDHFLYRILGEEASLEEIRSKSPLLIAAICTVSALHSEDLAYLYERCYQEFINLCSGQMFAKENNLDDIRALCIGAFWLNELSWALVGTAVRISTQIQLHGSTRKALAGDRLSYLQIRLYYLIYVCDHHFSIAYGRPPMTRECPSIRVASQLLQTTNATEDDARLVSQVTMWSLVTRIYKTFGGDVECPVPPELIPELRRFTIDLATWRQDWNDRFAPNMNVGNYPRKGVGLHFRFAKLYLCSHAFRGLGLPPTGGGGRRNDAAASSSSSFVELGPDLEEIANSAVLSAKTILRTIVADTELQSYLNGLPLYFDTMIAFAVVFLLKVATKYSNTIRTTDGVDILMLVGQLVSVLRNVTVRMHRHHLLVSVTEGVDRLLRKCRRQQQQASQSQSQSQPFSSADSSSVASYPDEMLLPPPPPPQQQQNSELLVKESLGWVENLCNYDFLSSHNYMPGLESWEF